MKKMKFDAVLDEKVHILDETLKTTHSEKSHIIVSPIPQLTFFSPLLIADCTCYTLCALLLPSWLDPIGEV